MTSKEFQIYRNPLLSVSVYLEHGLVCTRTRGLLSPLLKHFTRDLVHIFDRQIPAKVNGNTLYFSTWMPPLPGLAFDRLVRSQIRCLLAETASMVGVQLSTNPEQVTISITEECPNRCIHCALPDTRQKTSLEPMTITKIIDQAVDMGATQIIFDGGEPMVFQGLEDLVAHVPESAVSTVFTSGSGLTPEKARALAAAGLYAINVSLDSPQRTEHDRIRGREGVFDEAVAGIRNSLDAGLLVNIYVVVAPHNIHELDGFYDLAVELGVHELSFYEIVPTGRWMDRDTHILSPEHHRTLDGFVTRKRSGPLKVFSIPHVMEVTGCFAGRRWLHVTPGGDVLPCACIPIPYGNVRTSSLKDIWKRIQKTGIYRAKSCLMRDRDFRSTYLQRESL